MVILNGCVVYFRQSKEREALQQSHQGEVEEFMKSKGYSIPASPLMSTASASLSTGPILSPLNISSIPNPPPLPASLMSVQMRDPFPIFSVAQRRPNSTGSVSSFHEELYKYVEDLSARMHKGSTSNTPETKTDIASHRSETIGTESTEHRSTSPRIAYTSVTQSGNINIDNNQYSVAQSAGQSASIPDSMMQSPPIFMSNPVYNLHYPGTPFVSMAGGFAGQQMVEAGLLPMANSYTSVVPITTTGKKESKSEDSTIASFSSTKAHK